MEMKLLSPEQLEMVYRRDLQAAFPRAELKPLRAMREKQLEGSYHPWALFDGDEILGIATVWAFAEGWRLFDYLCVSAARRNGGLGSALIRGLLEVEKDCVIFGESEVPEFAADPALATRRLGFYKRNGAREAGYQMTLFGVPYEVLYWAERTVPPEEMMARHSALYQLRFGAKGTDSIYDHYIRIPWTAADGMPEQVDWAEVEARFGENSGI